jgi:hypothetical protein
VGLWGLLIATVFVWGDVLRRSGVETQDALPPLYATSRLLTWQMIPSVAFAALVVAVLPAAVERLPWRAVPLLGWAVCVGWSMVLAASDGIDAIVKPFRSANEYLAGLPALRHDGPLEWVRTFTDRMQSYPVHTKGHPPLSMLFLWLLDTMGLRGATWAAITVIVIGSSSVIAIAVTLKVLAGEARARQAVPFLALAPIALWIATAMDALYLGVSAWSVALLALATRRLARGKPVTRTVLALAAGTLLGSLPYLSYGLLPIFAVPLAVLLLTRGLTRHTAVALVCGLLLVPVLFTAGGFWWFAGVEGTHKAYESVGGSSRRPYGYFLLGDLGVLAILVGPAVAWALPCASWRRTRDATVWPAGAAMIGMLALDLSGVTKGEVERIWIPYAAWLLPIATLAVTGRRTMRGLLVMQAITAVAVQALVMSAW